MQADISPESLYNKGINEFEQGHYDDSIENFKKAIELDDSNYDYYFNLGVVYMEVEDYDAAIESFVNAYNLNPKVRDVELFNNLGTAYYAKRDYDKAAKSYSKSVWYNSGDPENLNNAGIAYIALKNYKEAVSNLKRAVKIEPKDENYNFNLAHAYYGAGEYDLAEEHLIFVVNYNKQRDDGYLLLGKVLIKRRDYDIAKDYLQKVLSLDPENQEAKSLIEKINSRKPCEDIVIEEQAGQESNGEKPKKTLSENEKKKRILTYFKIASTSYKNKDYKTVILQLNKVLKLQKDHPEAIKNIELAQKKLNEAKEFYQKGVKCLAENHYEQAVIFLEKALIIYPYSSKIEKLLSEALDKSKEKED